MHPWRPRCVSAPALRFGLAEDAHCQYQFSLQRCERIRSVGNIVSGGKVACMMNIYAPPKGRRIWEIGRGAGLESVQSYFIGGDWNLPGAMPMMQGVADTRGAQLAQLPLTRVAGG